jgi:hypothetical protein
MGLFFLLLPMFYRAHYEYLLWSEGFMERAFAKIFTTGHYQKLIETPKPLWNVFWLLSDFPNRLYFLVCILIAGVFLMFQLVSRKLTGSIIYGVLAFLITVFGFRDVFVLFSSGNWTVPYMLLVLIFLWALLSERWGWAVVTVGLSGLIRPESWLLALFLLVYLAHKHAPLRWYHLLPLLAPLLWAYYDYRVSGDWLFSFKSTAAYAVLTGVPGTDFLTFWPRLIPDIADSTGIVVLLFALAGILFRILSIARKTRQGKARAVLTDPLLVVTLLPLLAAWLMSVQGNLIIMRRFFYLSIGLLALYATIMPFELFRTRPVTNRGLLIGVIVLPLLLIAAVRSRDNTREGLRNVKVSEAKMAAIVELCGELLKPEADLGSYKYIFIPFRRYAQFTAFTNDSIARKFISYREVSLAVTSTQYAMLGEALEPPSGSPEFVRDLMLSKKRFSDFLPSLAVWVPDDEMHFIDAFSFDDPDYFHRNYIDKGRYAFRIVGSALDSLGLIYDVREISPEQIQAVAPPGEEVPEPTYRLSGPPEDR